MTHRNFAVATLAALFAACGSPPATPSDAGHPALDSGAPAADSGTPAPPDAGEPDAGAPDAGPADAGSFSLASSVTLVSGLSPAGVTVTLTGEGVDETATTDSTGGWSFSGLAPGLYHVAFSGSAPLPHDAGFPEDGGPAALPYSGEITSVVLWPDGGVLQNGQGPLYDSDGGLLVDDAGFIVDIWDAGFPLTPLALPAGDRIPGSLAVDPHSVSTSTDGHYTYATDVDEQGTYTVWLAAPGGTPARIATGTLQPGSLGFSPDGRYLTYQTGVDGNGNGPFWIVPVAGGNPVEVAPDSCGGFFSPDGTRLLLRRNCPVGSLTLYTLATGGTASVAQASSGWTFSPDGTEIAVVEATPDGGYATVVYTVATGASTTFPSTSPASFSPKGDLLALSAGATDDTIFLVGADGGTTPVTTAGFSPFWSPDGARLAYFGASNDALDGTLHLYTLTTGATVQVAATATPIGFGFSPDGASLAYFETTDANGAGPLDLYTLATAATVHVATSADPLTSWFTGDGKELQVAANPSYDAQGVLQDFTLELYRIAGGQTVQVATGVTSSYRSYDWSWLAFFSGASDANGNSTLSLAPLATGIVAQSIPDVESVYFLSDGAVAIVRDADPDGAGTLAVFMPGGTPVSVNDWIQNSWLAGSSLVAVRIGTPGPFGYMDGLWVTPLP